jgi:hypothetical protein
MIKDFTDKRGREWEVFIDACYFDLICVRWKDDRSFNSHTSFHFNTMAEASQFAELLQNAS